MMNKTILNEETTKDLDTFLRKIANRKKTVVMIDTEDLVQEFWLVAIDTIERLGRIDYGYISKACNNKTVNLVRKNISSFNSLPFDNSEFERCIEKSQRSNKKGNSEDDTQSHTYSYISNSKFRGPEEELDVKSILDLFDNESEEKERKLIKSWMEILGIIEIDDYKKLPESHEDSYIAVDVLGYASSGSNGYARLRNKVIYKLLENGYTLSGDTKRKF